MIEPREWNFGLHRARPHMSPCHPAVPVMWRYEGGKEVGTCPKCQQRLVKVAGIWRVEECEENDKRKEARREYFESMPRP